MKRLRFILCSLILGLLASSAALSAQNFTAGITNLEILHNQEVNGKPAIKVRSRITVDGMKGKECCYYIWLESPKGTAHIVDDTSQKRYDTKNFRSVLTPSYDSSVWETYTYTIYLSELQLKPGKHTYYLFATVNTMSGECVARSEYVSFTGTGSSDNNGNHNHQNHSHNSGEITCPGCNGSGQETCIMCGGSGQQFMGFKRVNCGTCNCTGKLRCRVCGGDGKARQSDIDAWYVHCMTCNGSGIATCLVCRGNGYTSSGWCSNCNGNGRKSCYSCKGYGKVQKSWNSFSGGGNSSGSGSSGSSGSGSYNSGSSSSRCSFCGGTGVCSSCNGRGGSWQDTGYYVGDNSQSWINCPSCRGSKQCFNCHGTGRL